MNFRHVECKFTSGMPPFNKWQDIIVEGKTRGVPFCIIRECLQKISRCNMKFLKYIPQGDYPIPHLS